MIDLEMTFDRYKSIMKEKLLYLLPITMEWKHMDIFQIQENIIILNNDNVVPAEQRSEKFKYIVMPEITLGSIAFTKGIITIIYNHFNTELILNDLIVYALIQQGIDEIDIQQVENNILIKNKKISGSYFITKNGYTSETAYIMFDYDNMLISEGFGNSDDLNEYSSIKSVYPDINLDNFLSTIYQMVGFDNVLSPERVTNKQLDTVLCDVNYKQTPIVLQGVLVENITKLLEWRKSVEIGIDVPGFKEFNNEVCFDVYKAYRPILENYDEVTKEVLYKNRYAIFKITTTEQLFGSTFVEFPIDIKWNRKGILNE